LALAESEPGNLGRLSPEWQGKAGLAPKSYFNPKILTPA
jgi:hypothetical protein